MTNPAQNERDDQPDLRSLRRTGQLLAALFLASLAILVLFLPLARSRTLLPAIPALLLILLLFATLLTLLRLRRQVREAQARLERLAFEDQLTGLPNRLAFERRLPQALAEATAAGQTLAVGVLDVDDFKRVNDIHGMTEGDRLLAAVATRLRAALPPPHVVGRLGPDEFVLRLSLPPGNAARADLAHRLDAVEAVFARPFPVSDGQDCRLAVSLGLALHPPDAGPGDLLFHTAFAALAEIKAKKINRKNWWHIAGDALPEVDLATAVQPYGPMATAALGTVAAMLSAATDRTLPQLLDLPASERLHASLTKPELAQVIAALRTHLLMLITPDLSEATHRSRSVLLGTVHALTGAPATDAMRLLDHFVIAMHQTVDKTLLTALQRLQAHTVLQSRFANEMQFEQEGRWHIDIERQQALAQIQLDSEAWRIAGTFPAELVQRLCGLTGICGAAWGRPDDDNLHVVEFSSGSALDLLGDLTRRRVTLRFGTREVSQEPCTLRAWSTGRIETTENIALDPRMADWAPSAKALGIRSAAAIPVLDETGMPVAVLTLYGRHSGQFSNPLVGVWLWALQELAQRGSNAALLAQPPIAVEQRRHLRAALYGDRLRMVLQPVVDLKTGRMETAEALARLEVDGQLLAPATFLPAFGTMELQYLFRRGLHIVLEIMARADDRFAGLGIGINLPPVVLETADCAQGIIDTLAQFAMPPGRLFLELLELDGSRSWKEHANATLHGLARHGIHLVMDDLGSGYSGLQRLRSLPFDRVKIDQNLIRQALVEPDTTIPFVGGLINVAHRLGLGVVAEGLESPDLVEMVAFLGADYGQGFALAYPMPAEALADWMASFTYTVDATRPQTTLGKRALQEMRRDRPLAALR